LSKRVAVAQNILCVFSSALNKIDSDIIDFDRINFDIIDLYLDTIMQN